MMLNCCSPESAQKKGDLLVADEAKRRAGSRPFACIKERWSCVLTWQELDEAVERTCTWSRRDVRSGGCVVSPDAPVAKAGVANRGWEKQPQTKHL